MADVDADVADALSEIVRAVEAEGLRYDVPDGVVVLAWDTESTGLGGVVVQLGVVGLDVHRRELMAVSRMFQPLEGHPMDRRARLVHGISTDDQRRLGEPVRACLAAFCVLAEEARSKGIPLVAHNASFDQRMLSNTARAVSFTMPDIASECTMRLGKRVAAERFGSRKAPRNAELYEMLVGSVPSGTSLHDAVADARLTAHSFAAGREQNLW